MKRGLIIFVLVIILVVGVIANSEVSEQVPSENTETQETSDSGEEVISDTGNDEIISDVPAPASDDYSDDNKGHGNDPDGCDEDNPGNSKRCDDNNSDEYSEENSDSAEDVTDSQAVNNEDTSYNSNDGSNNNHDYVNLPKETPINDKKEETAISNNIDKPKEADKKDAPSGLNSITGMIILDNGEIIICHKPNTPAEQTMNIPSSALNGHLGHGDYAGFCDDINFKADAGYDQAVNEKENVVFYGSSGIPDSFGLSVNYIWDFGDGKIISGVNLKNPAHVYDKEGVYYVKLTVKISDYISENIIAVDVSDVDN